MGSLLLTCGLIWCVIVRGLDIYEPTSEEIEQAVYHQTPPPSYGYNARKEKDLRLFVIGGSNTLHQVGYFSALHEYLNDRTAHPAWSGSVDRLGVSGTSLDNFVGMKYNQFEYLPTDRWPNVIMMEFSVNTLDAEMPFASLHLHQIIQTFRYKYSLAGLPDPEFVLLELFNVVTLVNKKSQTADPGLQWLNGPLSPAELRGLQVFSGKQKGCPACKELRDVADFYDIPIISWRNAAYKAFIRYFLNSKETWTVTPWIFTHDGLHFSEIGGMTVVDLLVQPFFEGIMNAREEEAPAMAEYDLRMFPAVQRNYVIESHSVWDTNATLHLSNFIRKPHQWPLVASSAEMTQPNLGRECFGSVDPTAKLQLDFIAPYVCTVAQPCRAVIKLLHSWNASNVGSVSCSLQRNDEVLVKDLSVNVTLDERGERLSHTTIIATEFAVPLRAGEKHSIECSKLDARLSCVAVLSIVTTVAL